MKDFNKNDLSRIIDNLSFSIKPKNYKEFKDKLIKMLMDKVVPGSKKTYYEIVFNYLTLELKDHHIKYSEEELMEHTMIVIALMGEEFTCDFEFELKGKYVCNQYLEVINRLLMGMLNRVNMMKCQTI